MAPFLAWRGHYLYTQSSYLNFIRVRWKSNAEKWTDFSIYLLFSTLPAHLHTITSRFYWFISRNQMNPVSSTLPWKLLIINQIVLHDQVPRFLVHCWYVCIYVFVSVCMFLCIKLFNMNNRAKLKTCLQPGSQSKALKSRHKTPTTLCRLKYFKAIKVQLNDLSYFIWRPDCCNYVSNYRCK